MTSTPMPAPESIHAPAPWWKQSVVYQIYPRSFLDTNGDGVGDLRGITARLDYLSQLGVDVIWLCPIYASPNDDNGYDISDYRAIAPEYGSLADFDELLRQMHLRGLKLVMDLVVNHTSDEHPWFREARQSKDNPYRDFYIWQPGKRGGPPSNWGSHFGGSAWTYDAQTDEYYLHLFSAKQPDLNWENPRVRQAIYSMMRFWLGRGVDGFRMDTINMLSKVPGFPDALGEGRGPAPIAEEHFLNGPRLLEYLREMKTEVLSHYDLLTVGETPGVTPEDGVALTHPENGVLSMVFQFEHMKLDVDQSHPNAKWTHLPWSLAELKRITTRWQHGLHGHGWNSSYLSNHDTPRMVSRFGDDGPYRLQSAKLLATFLHTLEGTPYLYQGDEIGMTNVQFGTLAEYRDVDSLNFAREQAAAGRPDAETLTAIYAKGRDNARTPMQWDSGPHAGFTTGTPWIGVNPNFNEINVAFALADPASIFWYYRELIKLRREYPVLVSGRYDLLLDDHPQIYAYTRTAQYQHLLVLLNFSAETVTLPWPDTFPTSTTRLLLANCPLPQQPEHPGEPLTLRPYEARIYLTANEAGDGMT